MNQTRERVFVIQPIEGDHYRVLQEEAVALIESANADYAGTVYQKIREVNPATYIGEGKVEEIREMLSGLDVTVLFNGELSPSQTLNISISVSSIARERNDSFSSWRRDRYPRPGRNTVGDGQKAHSFAHRCA